MKESLPDLEFLLRLLVATGCGTLVGIERQYRSRTAGLRTNALVAAGACAFVLFGAEQVGPTAQMAAYVVSGVGFLGGGVILRQGFTVQGLNTAATIWCSAAMGCLAAGGNLMAAGIFTAVVLGIHLVLRPVAVLLNRAPASNAELVADYEVVVQVRRRNEPKVRAYLLQSLDKPEVTVQGMSATTIKDSPDDTIATVELRVQMEIEGSPDQLMEQLVNQVSLEKGVRGVSWEAEENDESLEDLPSRSRWMLRRRTVDGEA